MVPGLRFATFERLTNITDIEDGVRYCRQLLASHPDNQLAADARLALNNLLYCAFVCTNNIEYLTEAISVVWDNLNAPDSLSFHFPALLTLLSHISTRLDLLDCREDLDELMQLFPMAANHEHVGLLCQFPVSCQWASTAHRFRHPSTSTAYDCAISSMQALLAFVPTIDTQHSRLVAFRGNFDTLPLDYASHLIRIGRLDQAIETLEGGRVLLWVEIRGLCTSSNKLHSADSRLAEKFASINRDFETLTLTFSPNSNIDSRDGGLEEMDPFGHLVMRQRKLLDDRDNLILQIQALPGFETFLKPPSLDTLRSAPYHGPVIILSGILTSSSFSTTFHPPFFPCPMTSMHARTDCKTNYWRLERTSSQINTRMLYVLYSTSSMSLSAGQ